MIIPNKFKRILTNILIVSGVLFLSSCENDPISLGEEAQRKETSIKILQDMDTTSTYYLYITANDGNLVTYPLDSTTYAINKNTMLVEHMVKNNSDDMKELVFLVIFALFLGGLLGALYTN